MKIQNLRFNLNVVKKLNRKNLFFITLFVVLMALLPFIRAFGINAAAPILEYAFGITSYHLISLAPPRLQLSEHIACSGLDDSKRIPTFRIWISPNDFSDLRSPGQTDEIDATGVRRKSFAKAEAEIRYEEKEAVVTDLRLRRRGFMQPRGITPLPLKIDLPAAGISKYQSSHFLPFAAYDVTHRAKDPRWYPFQTWVAGELGLFRPESRLVNLIINQQNWGVYWQFESWSQKTLEANGIPEGEVYGEDDDVVNSSFSYLWENADLWRKYQLKGAKNQTEAIDKIEDFSHLERFLHFLNHASNDEFKENYPKYIDFDKTVRWAVHNAIMDSYHQGNNRNARILYNTVTKKFEPIPWDNLPDMYGRIGTYQREAFMNHILLARFYNVVEFQRAYSELLYQTASKILAKASEIFHELYLSKSVRCAELENDFFVPRFDAPKLTGSQLFSYNGLKRMLFEPTWPETVQAMENATRSRLETLLAEFRNAHAFVYQSRTVSPETERSDAHLKLRYASRRASTLKRISISVKNKLANDKPIPVTVTFKTVPASSVYQVYLHDEELAARSDSKSVIGTVEGQNVVFDNLDFTLSPDFPEKSARFAAGAQEWSPVGYGAFDIFIDILDPDIWIIPGSTRVEVIASDKNPLNIKYRWADK